MADLDEAPSFIGKSIATPSPISDDCYSHLLPRAKVGLHHGLNCVASISKPNASATGLVLRRCLCAAPALRPPPLRRAVPHGAVRGVHRVPDSGLLVRAPRDSHVCRCQPGSEVGGGG